MRIRRGIAALLAALMLWTMLPAALTEPADEAPQPEAAQDALTDAAPEVSLEVEPEVGLSDDAGDTGLTIEYEQAPAEAGESEVDLPLEDCEAPDEAVEAPDDADEPADEAGDAEVMAVPAFAAGYAAVAPEVPVYADAERTSAIGVFPEGAAVYVESVEADGTLLRIRFDIADNRDWDLEIPTGYVMAEDALAYTDAESEALVQLLAADARTRSVDGVMVPCVAFTAIDYAVSPGESVVGLGVAFRTRDEIQAFVNAHPAYRNQLNIYSVAANDAPYTVGMLSPVNQQSALNMINQMRYIAGLDANVGMLTEQEDDMAATAMVLRLYSEQYKATYGKDILTHYPPRPASLADSSYDVVYKLGYTGAGRSNIAMGYTATGSILAYMSDAADNNIGTVGHRRWILNPRMGKTVFGANGRFSAMYAHDVSAAGGQSKVAWPAQEMPCQYFSVGDPWSLSYGRTLNAGTISVSLVRVRDGKTWNFSTTQADGAFSVDNGAYGQKGCVIFRPNGLDSIADGDTFNVSVTDGENSEITRYTVHFFGLDLSAATPMDALNVAALKTRNGNEISWSAAAGATGYYVCRRASTSSYYQIVADVTGTFYRDNAVFEDLTYTYQVYAHNASVTSRSAVSVEARPVQPESVALSASGTVSVYKNATLQLGATIAPANAMSKLTWKSSRTKVAVVDANGLVTPVNKGSAIISVTTENGKSASVKVKVVNPPKAKKVTLNASGTVVLNVGATLQLSGVVYPAEADQRITWSSSKNAAASVSAAGLVTANNPGTATITAKSASGKKAKVKIKVVDPYVPDSVTLNYKGTVRLKEGATLQLGATVLPATAPTTLTWTSSRPGVASVDESGAVSAVKRGTTTITVSTANGKKAKVKIRVVK